MATALSLLLVPITTIICSPEKHGYIIMMALITGIPEVRFPGKHTIVFWANRLQSMQPETSLLSVAGQVPTVRNGQIKAIWQLTLGSAVTNGKKLVRILKVLSTMT